MFGLLFFGSTVWLGWRLVQRLPLSFFWLEAYAAASVLGIFLSSWLAFLLILASGYQVGLWLSLLLMLGLILLSYFFPARQGVTLWFDFPRKGQFAAWFIFFSLLTFLLLYLFSTHMLQVKSDGWYSAGGAWGDLGLHTSLISFFTYQSYFSFDFPLYAGTKLTYPFLVDFYSALLLRGGLSWQLALSIPSFVLALSFTQLLFFWTYRLVEKVKAGIITVTLLFLNGSFLGFWYAWQDWRIGGESLPYFLAHLSEDYAHLERANLDFTNSLTTLLLPQRGFLLGLPLFILAMRLIEEVRKKSDQQRWLLGGISGLVGLLPLVHVHTFLVVIALWGWSWLLESFGKRKVGKKEGLALGGALLLALPQIYWQFNHSFSSDFGRFQLGWTDSPSESLPFYLFKTWGLALICGLLLLWQTYKDSKKSPFLFQLLSGLFLVFLAAHLYLFQPNPYDNLKLLIFWYLGLSVFLGITLAKALEANWLKKLGAILIIISLSLTGLLSLIHELPQSYRLVSTDDQVFAEEVRRVIPAESLILTSDRHNHPVSMLSGRSILMGYRGWLWTYGIDYRERERDIGIIYRGEEGAQELLQKYGINYLVIGLAEIQDFQANRAWYQKHYLRVISHSSWEVYQIDLGLN